jgi:holo-[acyl-carrier protein] synthase
VIVGLGMDLCAIDRIRRIVEGPRGQRFLQRVFTEAERALCGGRVEAMSAYAARFAAKEALVKALGAPKGVTWQDMEVAREQGAPYFKLSGVAAEEVAKRNCRPWLTITHDHGIAAATVVLEVEK